MKNILKNFYCDYILLVKIDISFIDKIIFLLNKYIFLFFSVFGIKIPTRILGRRYYSDDSYGLLGFQVMLKDFYEYYFIPSLKDPVIFDVGGHIGNFTLAANVFYKKSKIYLFEPIKKTYNLAAVNLKEESNVQIYNIAIGDSDGKKKMYFDKNELSISSFNADSIINQDRMESQEVVTIKLSTFIREHNIEKIDLLKIDVEGFELEVLRGSLDIMDRVHNIIIEVHVNKEGKRLNELFLILTNYGFTIAWIGKIWQGSGRNKNLKCFDLILKRR